MVATFEEQVKAFAKKAAKNIDQATRGVSIKLFSAVIMGSPVDTGRFRGNWQAGGASAPTGELDIYDEGGQGTVAAMTQAVKSEALATEFTLSNNLPYAAMLEYGAWSDQAPQGMVRINVARFQTFLDAAAQEVNR